MDNSNRPFDQTILHRAANMRGYGGDDEIDALWAAVEVLARLAGVEMPEADPECLECDNRVDSNDPQSGYGMCGDCLHDAKRSGWTPDGGE